MSFEYEREIPHATHPLLYFQRVERDPDDRPSPAIPDFLKGISSSSSQVQRGTTAGPLRVVEESLHAGRQRISEARVPSPVPDRGRVTRGIHEVFDDAAAMHYGRAELSSLPTSVRVPEPQLIERRRIDHVPVNVPGFEKAIDTTALAEEAAVKAEEAVRRALQLTEAAGKSSALASELRAKQKAAQEERAAIEEKIIMVDIKRDAFERVRGEAEQKAREYEGAKIVVRGQEDILKDLTAALQKQIAHVNDCRMKAQKAQDELDDMGAKLHGLTARMAEHDFQKEQFEVEGSIDRLRGHEEHLRQALTEAQEAMEQAATRLSNVRQKHKELEDRVSQLEVAVGDAEAQARGIEQTRAQEEREEAEKKEELNQTEMRLQEVKPEVEAAEQHLSAGIEKVQGRIEAVNAAVEVGLEKQREVLAVRDKAVSQAREARHLSAEARATAAEAELARNHVTQTDQALAAAVEQTVQAAERGELAHHDAVLAEQRKEAAWEEAKRQAEDAIDEPQPA